MATHSSIPAGGDPAASASAPASASTNSNPAPHLHSNNASAFRTINTTTPPPITVTTPVGSPEVTSTSISPLPPLPPPPPAITIGEPKNPSQTHTQHNATDSMHTQARLLNTHAIPLTSGVGGVGGVNVPTVRSSSNAPRIQTITSIRPPPPTASASASTAAATAVAASSSSSSSPNQSSSNPLVSTPPSVTSTLNNTNSSILHRTVMNHMPHRHHTHSMSERTMPITPIQQMASLSASSKSTRKSPAPLSNKVRTGGSTTTIAASGSSNSSGSTSMSGSVPTGSPSHSERNSPVPSSIPTSLTPLMTHPLTHTLPILTPPPQWQMIETNLYRCGKFGDLHGPFLSTLQLRTLIYLSPPSKHPLSSYVKLWSSENGVEIYNLGHIIFGEIDMDEDGNGFITSSSCITLYNDLIRLTLDHLLQASNSPCLIMCHSGLDLCSIVVGCLRRLQGWCFTSMLEEWTRSHMSKVLQDEILSTSTHHQNHRLRNRVVTNKGVDTTTEQMFQQIGGVGGVNVTSNRTTIDDLRYTTPYDLGTANTLSDEARTRMEELIEIFDLNLVKIPELGRKQSMKRSITQNGTIQHSGDVASTTTTPTPTASATAATTVTGTPNCPLPPSQLASLTPIAPPSSLCVEWFRTWLASERRELRLERRERRARRRYEREEEEKKAAATNNDIHANNDNTTTTIPTASALPTWSTPLTTIFNSSQLVSANVRYDKKMSLVDEDED